MVTCPVCDCDASSSISVITSSIPLDVLTPSSTILSGENRQSYGSGSHSLIAPSPTIESKKSANGAYIGVLKGPTEKFSRIPFTYTSFTLSPLSLSASCATSSLQTVGGQSVSEPVFKILPLMPGKNTTLEQHSCTAPSSVIVNLMVSMKLSGDCAYATLPQRYANTRCHGAIVGTGASTSYTSSSYTPVCSHEMVLVPKKPPIDATNSRVPSGSGMWKSVPSRANTNGSSVCIWTSLETLSGTSYVPSSCILTGSSKNISPVSGSS